MIVGVGKPGRVETEGRVDIAALSPKAACWQSPFLFGEAHLFFFRPSTDCGDNLLYPKSTDLNVNFV